MNPCKLVTVALQKRSCSRSEHKQFYKDILVGLHGVRVQYGTGELCHFCGVDVMILQDNLCKLVEVLQTTFTRLFFGKSRCSVEGEAPSSTSTSD